MFTWFKKVVVKAFIAFFKDDVAFERWMRGLGNWFAGTFMISLASVLPLTDDPLVAYKMLTGWTSKEWLTRIGAGFLFFIVNARVHKGPSIDDIHKALEERGVLVVPPAPVKDSTPSQP